MARRLTLSAVIDQRLSFEASGRASGGRRPPLVAASASTITSGREGHQVFHSRARRMGLIARPASNVKEYIPMRPTRTIADSLPSQ
jgi:hypothetical protein